MKRFDLLYKEAIALTNVTQLSEYASCGSVGSTLMSEKGKIYSGICIDSPCGIGFCAEHAAIAEMLKNGESRISAIIAVTADAKIVSPCGRCRELILQINKDNKNTLVYLSKIKTKKLSQLLPDHWQT